MAIGLKSKQGTGTSQRPTRGQRPQRPVRGKRPETATPRTERPQRPTRGQEPVEEQVSSFGEESFGEFDGFDNFEGAEEVGEVEGVEEVANVDSDLDGLSEIGAEPTEDGFDDLPPITDVENVMAEDSAFGSDFDDSGLFEEVQEKEVEAEAPAPKHRPQRRKQGSARTIAEESKRIQNPKSRKPAEETPATPPVQDNSTAKKQLRKRRVRDVGVQEEIKEEEDSVFSFNDNSAGFFVSNFLDYETDNLTFDENGNLIKKQDSVEKHESVDLTADDDADDVDTISARTSRLEAISRKLSGEEEDISLIDVPTEEPAKEEPKDLNSLEDMFGETEEQTDPVAEETPVETKEEEKSEEPEKVEKSQIETNGTTLLEVVKESAQKYKDHALTYEIENITDLKIQYDFNCEDSVSAFGPNVLAMPNNRVYVNNKLKVWDKAQEATFKSGDVIELDTGCHIKLPQGYGIKFMFDENLMSKYGLSVLTSKKVYSRFDAVVGINVKLCANTDTSYVARFQPVLFCEVIKVNEAV